MNLALIEDDPTFRKHLGEFLREHGIGVTGFDDSDALLVDPAAFDFDFYLVDLGLPGIDGVDLVRVIRRRTRAGIVVISGRAAPEAFSSSIQAGADMYLAKPVHFEQVLLAIEAVQRRIRIQQQPPEEWKFDRRGPVLVAPDGTRIALSPGQAEIVARLIAAGGEVVPRAQLLETLPMTANVESDNALHATIYRLRRHVERHTQSHFPLQSVSRVGYVFRARLVEV